MPGQITREQAEECLARLRQQFARDLSPGGTGGPQLYPPGHEGDFWALSWEEGPEGWTTRAFQSSIDEEVYGQKVRELVAEGVPYAQADEEAERAATVPGAKAPDGVFIEPATHFALGLYPCAVPRTVLIRVPGRVCEFMSRSDYGLDVAVTEPLPDDRADTLYRKVFAAYQGGAARVKLTEGELAELYRVAVSLAGAAHKQTAAGDPEGEDNATAASLLMRMVEDFDRSAKGSGRRES
jgi:hypothetical protein